MILSQPLVLAATLPHLINTFGAASVILSPILNMLLFAAAVYLVFHIFNIAQQSNLFRNIFAAIGVLSTYNYIQDSLSRSTNRFQSPINGYIPVFAPQPNPPGATNRWDGNASIFNPSPPSHRDHGHSYASLPSTAHSHHSNQSRHMYGHL